MLWPALTSISETRHEEAPGLEQEAERRLEEAYQAGFRKGEAAGRSQVELLLQRLAATIEEMGSLRACFRREAETDLLKLAVAIARRILHRELTVDPETIEGLIKAALERLQSQDTFRVRVHPSLEPAVRNCLERSGPARRIEVIADRTREPGDVVFETERGSLDASITTQLEEIERGLADRLRRES
jgi:flagellar assembly protein FliH